MNIEALRENIRHSKEILKEVFIFTNQLNVIKNLEVNSTVIVNTKEKKLLSDAITSLTNQLKILNNSVPEIIEGIGFFQKLKPDDVPQVTPVKNKLIQIKYTPTKGEEKISLVISDKEKKDFLDNLSKSNLSMNQLKRDFSLEKPTPTVTKPNFYAKLSNKIFKNFSNQLVWEGYFNNLNLNLRRMNSPFIVTTYVSMIFLTMFIGLIFGVLFLILLLFFNLSIEAPFLIPITEPIIFRLASYFWVTLLFPLALGILMYFYPFSEAKNIGAKIDQELPFVTIHMSAIATSGVEPMSIFKIIIKSQEYVYSNGEFRKLLNLVNFHGKDLVTALKSIARTSASDKLKDLLDGLATAITSGGDIHEFLDKHSETLLFDYRLERERYTKTSETFMDIYISIVIAAPMILLMLFVIMGSTGILSNFLGLSTQALGMLIILGIIGLNIGFLFFLKMKQPTF